MRTFSSALLAVLATSHTCLAFITPSPHSSYTFAFQKNHISTFHLQSSELSCRRHRRHDCNMFMSTTEVDSGTGVGTPGTADLPWSELGFEFRPTKSHLRMVFRDGKWGEAELVEVRLLCVKSFCVRVVSCFSSCVV